MKLLLDEHYSAEIARLLQARGHDAAAVAQTDVAGSDDEPLLVHAAGERRALLTNNVGDFVPIAERWWAQGRGHYGLLFTSDAGMPRARATIGLYVDVLTTLMEAHPAEDAMRDQMRWVRPRPRP